MTQGELLSEPRWRLGHQPTLQGVRAVAVLAVFALHIGLIGGGWLGVEVFFVLSGFLITVLLLSECEGRGLNIKHFYLRRLARLMPAVVLMLAASMLWWQLTGFRQGDSTGGVWASLFYFANWAEIVGWDMHGLSHMWSLSIEEQFYVVWPAVIALVASRWGSRGVAWVAGIGFVGSCLLRLVLLAAHDDWYTHVYYGSGTRAAGILAGCLGGALLYVSRGALAQRVPTWLLHMLWAGVAACMVFAPIDSTWTWSVLVSLVDLATVVILVGMVGRRTWLTGVLSAAPVVYIGEISYGVYLWHVPVIQAANEMGGPLRYVVQLIVPFVVAIASYHGVERPIRRYVARGLRPPALAEGSRGRSG